MGTAGGAKEGAFKVNSLTGLDRASAVEGIVVWDGPRGMPSRCSWCLLR